ncbi:MAG: flagellar biosynthetic protein FliR [Sphingomonadaceae bacterium]|nr:flagellar biosynthetic protein FliR [Sphingomonadaceae bacterium]
MIPTGLENLEQQALVWMLAMIRPGAAFLAAPLFGAGSVPVQLRLVLALAVGIPSAAAANMVLPAAGIISIPGFFFIVAEAVAGLALGFVIQIVFATALVAGEAISNAMGLGFVSMADPGTGSASPAVGQFLSMLAMFLFLAADGHLALIATIAESYRALPPGAAWLSFPAVNGIAKFGSLAFAAGLSIALPVGFALVLVQIIMAMIARSAPALNLFAVGMPAALLAGILLLGTAAPVMADTISSTIRLALDQAQLVGGGNG